MFLHMWTKKKMSDDFEKVLKSNDQTTNNYRLVKL
jgi:hypothetical protein